VDNVILSKFLFEKLPNISREKIRERLQLNPGYCALALLDLHDDCSRHTEPLRDFFLRHRASFTGTPDPVP
jgi:hypothetical protein